MSTFSKKNETTVTTTTIGAAIAVVLVWVGSQLVNLTAVDASVLVGAFTTIFNYFIPVKKRIK